MGPSVSFALCNDDIHALIDGEQTSIHAAGVAAAVYADRELSARVADYRAQNGGLKALYDDVKDEPLPAAMIALLEDLRPTLRIAC